jgi:hypothetical protein
MTPGPNLVYKCPNCGKFSTRGSINSGNTFGAKIYSDGKRIAPMLPEFPAIIKCKGCEIFYWLNDENEVGEYDFFEDKINKEWKNADRAEFLNINEYNEAINLKVYKDEDDHKFLRIKLWQAINDKFRNNLDMIEYEKEIYEENCLKLIEILDKNEIYEKIMCAEIYRNLGNFIECKNILETISEEKYLWIKKIIENECILNNKKVIELKQ